MNLIEESFQAKEEKKKKMTTKIILGAIIVVVLVIIGIWNNLCSNKRNSKLFRI